MTKEERRKIRLSSFWLHLDNAEKKSNNIVYFLYTIKRCKVELHRTQILLEKGQHQILSLIAEEEKRSLSEIVREMIERELRYRQRRQMLLAARELQADYSADPNLTQFTALDGDKFLFEDEM
jgi:hypothetical protein